MLISCNQRRIKILQHFTHDEILYIGQGEQQQRQPPWANREGPFMHGLEVDQLLQCELLRPCARNASNMLARAKHSDIQYIQHYTGKQLTTALNTYFERTYTSGTEGWPQSVLSPEQQARGCHTNKQLHKHIAADTKHTAVKK